MGYDNTNKGALFKNDRREKDSHPDLSGAINIDGKDYWLSGWTKRNPDNTFKVLSLSVKPKESKPGRAKQAEKESFPETFQDDDIPF